MRARESRLRWWIAPITFAFGSLVLDASIVATDYVAKGRIASAAPRTVTLRGPASFASISNESARSRALFAEAGKVLLHERCVNCHPAGEQPLQGKGEPHQPGVVRGEDGFGAVALRCNTCHQAENYEASGVPGHPKWHVAPREMAWEGKSLGAICEQIKDPARNGGMDLSKLHEHVTHDTLVGWAWNPGKDREPAPGTQARLGELFQAWIDTGAVCPSP
ncbi:MAG: Isoquinoline 1-oxidoreductase subunit [Polyangiales bacterium]